MLKFVRYSVLNSLLFVAFVSFGQNSDDVLFSVEGTDVTVSEFEYIYNKNNRENADYSRNSIMEYLDLYTKFKLKVTRARELRLDTIVALQNELAGYRSQLAKSYLNDKEVQEKLAREAYDRMKEDLSLSHILFRVDADASEETRKLAYDGAVRAIERLQAGESFEQLATDLSEDTNSAARGGILGFLAAIYPDGFYNMESAAYDLEVGGVSDPVRSTLGYHILRLNTRRPARGQIEAAHILVRVKPDGSNESSAKQKVDAIMRSLQQGKVFEEMARTLSDDEPTAKRGGFIGKIGINMYETDFENAAFGINEVGGYSQPVRTRIGWHIIKLLKKVRLEPFENERRKIEARLARDERIQIATNAMIASIKKESGFSFDEGTLNSITDDLNEDFLTFQWKVPAMDRQTIIRFNNGQSHSNFDFATYLKANTRERMRAQKGTPPKDVAHELFEAFVNDKCLEFEESQLEKKHPDFAALMREYEEGILLFEVTKMKVWDPASTDTAGLRAFHNAHLNSYVWPERAEVHVFRIDSDNPKAVAKAYKLASKLPTTKAVAKMNKKGPVLTYETKKYTKEESFQAALRWTPERYVTDLLTREGESHSTFSKVDHLIPETPKKLNEARGYIIADYQDQLEREWVERLKARYNVNVNQQVLKSLVKE